jgi:hypothetical protein
MKLKGIIKKPDGTDIEGFCEIVNINITEPTVSVAVHLYYFEDGKKKYRPIDGCLTKRYEFPLADRAEEDIYHYCYSCLLTVERFKNFEILV